jgi:hypothetical protein
VLGGKNLGNILFQPSLCYVIIISTRGNFR